MTGGSGAAPSSGARGLVVTAAAAVGDVLLEVPLVRMLRDAQEVGPRRASVPNEVDYAPVDRRARGRPPVDQAQAVVAQARLHVGPNFENMRDTFGDLYYQRPIVDDHHVQFAVNQFAASSVMWDTQR